MPGGGVLAGWQLCCFITLRGFGTCVKHSVTLQGQSLTSSEHPLPGQVACISAQQESCTNSPPNPCESLKLSTKFSQNISFSIAIISCLPNQ